MLRGALLRRLITFVVESHFGHFLEECISETRLHLGIHPRQYVAHVGDMSLFRLRKGSGEPKMRN